MFRNPHHSFPSSSPSSGGGARAMALAVSLSFASAPLLTWSEHRGLETASRTFLKFICFDSHRYSLCLWAYGSNNLFTGGHLIATTKDGFV